MSPSRRVDPRPSGSNPVITGAHSRRDLGTTGPTPRAPRHLKTRAPRRRLEVRRGRVIATSGVLAAALVAVVSYLAASSGGPSKDAAGHSHGSSNVTTTLPAVTSTRAATSTTRPAVSTTTTSPPTSTSTTTTSTTPPASVVTDPPSDVLVEVLNGVGTPNVALEVARALHRFGFAINGVGNAGAFDHTRNLIEYGPNSFAAAETVAAYVSGVPQYREYSALQANEVWVILGATYNGVTP